jgi:hypothetical protein
MRYIALKSKGVYLVRDLATWEIVSRKQSYGAAMAEARRLSAAYIQKLQNQVHVAA